MNSDFFSNDDLADLFEEMDALDDGNSSSDDAEMQASKRRFDEIIKKHRNEV
ncbi:MAG: hypothetical protein IIW01_11885 [Thermoguttaceae bacterium]|nr:hypothetical protein [Thermoguttaceae bacterium]